MAGATAAGQLIVLLALPFLTRLYMPDEFGAAAAYAGVVGLFVVVASLRYELAIPLPGRDRAAFHLVVLALVLLVISAFLAGVTWLAIGRGFDFASGLSDQAFAALVAVGVLTAGGYQVANYWSIRKSGFQAIARTRIQQGLAGNSTQIAFGLAGFGIIGLILGQIIGQCAGIVSLAAAMKTDHRSTGGRIHSRGLIWAAKRYRRFPLFDSWAGLLNVAGGQAPVLLFAALFSPVLAGYYALAYRVLAAPIGLVGKAISQPLLTRVAELNRNGGNAAPLMKTLLGGLAMLSLPPFAIVSVLSADIVPVVFGPQWAPAAPVVAWTAIWVGWQLISSPLSVTLIAMEAQRLNALLQVSLTVARVAALLAGAAVGSDDLALAGFSVASLLGYAGFAIAVGRVAGVSFVDIGAAALRPALIAGLCLSLALLPTDLNMIRYGAVVSLFGYWLWSSWTIVQRRLMIPAAYM